MLSPWPLPRPTSSPPCAPAPTAAAARRCPPKSAPLGRATASNALPAAAAQPFLPLGIDTERIEASRGVVLAQSTWDELHLLGGAGDLLVWWGTSGAQTCIAIEARDLSFARACGNTAEVRSDGLAAAVGYQSDGALTQVTVSLEVAGPGPAAEGWRWSAVTAVTQ